MLVLSRKPNEEILIDGHITVTVLGVEGKRVRLGIEAPKEVCILRKELKTILNVPSGLMSWEQQYRPDLGPNLEPVGDA